MSSVLGSPIPDSSISLFSDVTNRFCNAIHEGDVDTVNAVLEDRSFDITHVMDEIELERLTFDSCYGAQVKAQNSRIYYLIASHFRSRGLIIPFHELIALKYEYDTGVKPTQFYSVEAPVHHFVDKTSAIIASYCATEEEDIALEQTIASCWRQVWDRTLECEDYVQSLLKTGRIVFKAELYKPNLIRYRIYPLLIDLVTIPQIRNTLEKIVLSLEKINKQWDIFEGENTETGILNGEYITRFNWKNNLQDYVLFEDGQGLWHLENIPSQTAIFQHEMIHAKHSAIDSIRIHHEYLPKSARWEVGEEMITVCGHTQKDRDTCGCDCGDDYSENDYARDLGAKKRVSYNSCCWSEEDAIGKKLSTQTKHFLLAIKNGADGTVKQYLNDKDFIVGQMLKEFPIGDLMEWTKKYCMNSFIPTGNPIDDEFLAIEAKHHMNIVHSLRKFLIESSKNEMGR